MTSIYRKYLDLYEESPEDYKVEAADMERLLCLGNRNGFTKGYYEMRNGRSMMTLTDSSHSSNDAKTAYEAAEERKLPIVMRAVVHAEKPMELSAAVCEQETMQGNGAPVKTEILMWGMATGACPGQAQNRPLSREELEKRLRKTGDTPFVVTDIDIDLEDGLFVPVGQLNELRRSALEQLQEQMLSVSRRPSVGEQKQNPYQTEEPAFLKKSRQPFLNVWISTEKQLPMLLKHPYVAMVTLDGCGNAAKLAEQIHQAGKRDSRTHYLMCCGKLLNSFWKKAWIGISLTGSGCVVMMALDLQKIHLVFRWKNWHWMPDCMFFPGSVSRFPGRRIRRIYGFHGIKPQGTDTYGEQPGRADAIWLCTADGFCPVCL